jgi:hypothetical protein
MARDLGMLEDDMGSIQDKRGQLRRPAAGTRPMVGAGGGAPIPPVAPKRRMADPADANIYTADKGMPPSPDDMGSIENLKGKMMKRKPGYKKGGCVKKMASGGYAKGGSTGSASKRADGCAQRGKTKGKML